MNANLVNGACRLALRFDVELAAAEALAVPQAVWQTHFNSNYHNGGWQAVALRESELAVVDIAPGDHSLDSFRDSAMLANCPAIAQLAAQIPCPQRSIRIMRLASGGIIREHVDAGVSLASGEARLHIVLDSDEHTHFLVDQKRVPMRSGECWYVDVSRPHRVANSGPKDRIHLVIDCVANPWLVNAVSEGDQGDPYPTDDGPQAAFKRFRDMVFADTRLQGRLLAKEDRGEFMTESVEAGKELGFNFTEDEVDSAMKAGRRTWIEQWIL
jgi:hypothetical protein